MSSELSKSFRENDELVSDLARFSESVLTEQQVRKKHHLLGDEAWERMGTDDLLVEMVEAEKVRRIRNGAAKREKAQLHVVAGPDVLREILKDPKANAKQRIDASKALDDLAGFAPQRSAAETDRVIIHIDMGADVRARGLESNPADVLHIEAAVRPSPNPNDTQIIDARTPMIEAGNFDQQEAIPPKRGPGRPKGSKNKPKTIDERPKCVPGFDVT